MTIFDMDVKRLLRKHAGRWGKLLDTLNTLKSYDSGHDKTVNRLLKNGFRVSTYVSEARDTLETDRANAVRAVRRPLAEAIGHIITIEMADIALERLKTVEDERLQQKSDLYQNGACEEHRDFIAALYDRGVHRGIYRQLRPEHLNAIATYVLRKHAAATGYEMPLRTPAETRLSNKTRAHRFWDPYVPYEMPEAGL